MLSSSRTRLPAYTWSKPSSSPHSTSCSPCCVHCPSLPRCEATCRASPAQLPPAHSCGLWPVSVVSLLRIPEGNVGSGNWIPLSLIKMQICTVNEGSNLEAIWPGQVSHQLLFSVGRLGMSAQPHTGHIWPASREELFTLEEDTMCGNHCSQHPRGEAY